MLTEKFTKQNSCCLNIGAQDMWAGGGDRKMKTEMHFESRNTEKKRQMQDMGGN